MCIAKTLFSHLGLRLEQILHLKTITIVSNILLKLSIYRHLILMYSKYAQTENKHTTYHILNYF